jgi:type IV pilus assembly protein PilW
MKKQKMTHVFRAETAKTYSLGFSLIELMISLVIGSVILLGLVSLFSVNSGNQNELEKNIRKLENIRYSMDTMSEDLMHAGFYSDFNPNSLSEGLSYQIPNPCLTTVATTTDQGWNSQTTPVLLPVPIQGISKTDTTTATCLANRRSNTAAVIIRRAETGAGTAIGAGLPAGATADATTSTNLYIQISGCTTDAKRILVSPGPAANLTLNMPNCTTKASPVRRLLQRIYYIASCNDCVANDGIPTLKRIEMINGTLQTAAIAEGIEDMQFEYGIDNTTPFNGQSDSYVSNTAIAAYTATDWSNVVDIRVHLLARNTQTTAGYSDSRTYQVGPDVSMAAPADGYKRTLLTTTVRLNNVAGRRE